MYSDNIYHTLAEKLETNNEQKRYSMNAAITPDTFAVEYIGNGYTMNEIEKAYKSTSANMLNKKSTNYDELVSRFGYDYQKHVKTSRNKIYKTI